MGVIFRLMAPHRYLPLPTKPGQIIEQLLLARKHLRANGDDTPILRMVFMGMGEPFDNYDAVTQALSVLTEQAGKMLLGPRKVTVSTVGIVPQMERFLRLGKPLGMLAVSLHATTDAVRCRCMYVCMCLCVYLEKDAFLCE